MKAIAKYPNSFLLTLLCMGMSAASPPASAGEKFVVRTNWSDKTITNQVEVRMPRNVFVNQYFTNYTDSFRTNTVVTYVTNVFTKTLTNTVALTLVRTNVVDNFHTNYIAKTITHEIPVEVVQTNMVALYRTNLQTLSLTNWQTVLVMTTNWVTQKLTNTVQINAFESTATATSGPRSTAVPASQSETYSALASGGEPSIQAFRTQKPAANNLAEIKLKVSWPGDTADPLPVSQWRIELQNGNFLSFGAEEEFVRELPFGTYGVQARLFRAVDAASLVVRCTLKVGASEALVQQRSSGKKLLSSAP
jgi:hypothetical protein